MILISNGEMAAWKERHGMRQLSQNCSAVLLGRRCEVCREENECVYFLSRTVPRSISEVANSGIHFRALPKRIIFRFGNYQNGYASVLVIVFGAEL